METFLLVTHVILSFVIVVVILLQSGKGGGLGAGFDNAAAMGQEVFGGRGAAGFLEKLTVALGILFFVTSMSLAWYSSKPQSALDLEQEVDEPAQAMTHDVVDEGGEDAPALDEMRDQLPEPEGATGGDPLQQLEDEEPDDPGLEIELGGEEADLQEVQDEIDVEQDQQGDEGDIEMTVPEDEE